MSDGADRGNGAILPPEWTRLERSAEELSIAVERWSLRAREAEEEIERLRQSLEELAGDRPGSADLTREVRRLKAENAALRSRMLQARKRVSGLLQRLAAVEVDR